MDIQTAATFLMWCTFINGSILVILTLMYIAAPKFAYRIETKWFPCSVEIFRLVSYSLLGVYKIVILAFNVAPLGALLIIG